MNNEQTLYGALLNPRSIIFVGASADASKVSGRAFKHLVDKGYGGNLYPVHPHNDSVLGVPVQKSIAKVPGPADLGVIAVPAADVPRFLDELGRVGTRVVVVFSSGFGEMGADGKQLEARCLAVARSHGMRMLGPNSLGFVNAFDGVCPSFSQFAEGNVAPGPVAFVTQSGAFGTAIAALARRRGLGIGYFVHTGNETDINFAEPMAAVLEDPRIRVGAAYLEGIRDGKSLIAAAGRALALGKPLVVTKVGRTVSGLRAAASHTGALATDEAVFDGVARQTGLIRADNEGHLLNILDLIVNCPLPGDGGLGIITQSGGAGVLMADKAEELGLAVPVLAPETQARLRDTLPGFAAVANPVDVTAAFISDPEMLTRAVEITLNDPNVGMAVVWLQLMEQHVDRLVAAIAAIRDRSVKPFVVVWVAAPDAAVNGLREREIPVFAGGEEAIGAIAPVLRYAQNLAPLRAAVPALPAPAAQERVQDGLVDRTGVLPTLAAARLLADCGVFCVDTRLARSASEAADLADAMGYPVALKVESADLPHKSDVGGLRLGLAGPEEVRAAFDDMVAEVGRRTPQAVIDGVVVQTMAPAGVEMVVGIKRDPVFGPVLMLGIGGVFVEVLKDVAFRRVPLAPWDVEQMLDELRGAAILDGARGRPAVDRKALADFVCAVSRFAAAAGDRLEELDINPVICGPDGLVAVDWLMVAATHRSPPGHQRRPATVPGEQTDGR